VKGGTGGDAANGYAGNGFVGIAFKQLQNDSQNFDFGRAGRILYELRFLSPGKFLYSLFKSVHCAAVAQQLLKLVIVHILPSVSQSSNIVSFTVNEKTKHSIAGKFDASRRGL
jgi:hypothetical protein